MPNSNTRRPGVRKLNRIPKELLVFANEIHASRERFLSELEEFPAPIRKFIVGHYRERTRRAAGHPLFGELAPWVLANLVGLNACDRIRKVSTSWLFLYLYTLLIDDQLDRSERRLDSRLLWISSGLLLQKGLSSMYDSAGSNKTELSALIDLTFNETAGAVTSELLSHKGKLKHYTAGGLELVGKKNSFAKLLAGALCLSAGRRLPGNKINTAIDHFAQALQLRDDVTDWEEDLIARNFTYLLTTTAEGLSGSLNVAHLDLSSLTRDAILLSFITTKSLENTLVLSFESIKKVVECSKVSGTPAACYLAYMANTNHRGIILAQRMYGELQERQEQSSRVDWLFRIARTQEGRQQAIRTRKLIKIITQNT